MKPSFGEGVMCGMVLALALWVGWSIMMGMAKSEFRDECRAGKLVINWVVYDCTINLVTK